MRKAIIAGLLAGVTWYGPAFATNSDCNGSSNCNTDNSTTNQGGTGIGVGIGKGGDASSFSGSSSSSKAGAAAGAAAVGLNRNANTSGATSSSAGGTGGNASQDTNIDASSSDRTNIPVGAAISLSYAPNANPEATIDAAARTVVTNTSYHFLDPLWGHAFQDVQPTVEFSYFLAIKSYEFSNEGYAATAILCAKEPGVAKQLRRACE